MSLICKKCKRGFLKQSALERHYLEVHKISPTFSCIKCGYNSPSRKSANKHYNQCLKNIKETRSTGLANTSVYFENDYDDYNNSNNCGLNLNSDSNVHQLDNNEAIEKEIEGNYIMV